MTSFTVNIIYYFCWWLLKIVKVNVTFSAKFVFINWDIFKTNECNTDLSFDIFKSKIKELLDKQPSSSYKN